MSNGRVLITQDATLDSGETCHTFYPVAARPGFPVIFCHGAGLNDMISGNKGWPHGALFSRVLRRAGIAVSQPLLAGTNMANDAAMSRITTALNTLATRTGCSNVKAHLFGISMGGAVATRYAALNPSKVASVNALIPLSSIINLAKQNPGQPIVGGFTSMVATAWGLTWRTKTDGAITNGNTTITSASGFLIADNGRIVVSNTGVQGAFNNKVPIGATLSGITVDGQTTATLSAAATATASSLGFGLIDPLPTSTPNADLVALAPAIASASIPYRLFYSSVDFYVPAADVTALASAAGGSATAIDSTFGHADGTLGELAAYSSGINFSEYVAYVKARGA